MPGICGRKKGTGKAEKTMGGRRERMDGDDDSGLCEEREEQGAMEEGDVVDSGLRSAAMRMATTTTTFFTFVRKAFQQQLSTAAKLFRWKKTDSDKCPLCGDRQTNKQTLNNCASPSALARYKRRHDGILEILAQWITSMVREEGQVFVDLVGHPNNQIADIFTSLRPDIVVKHRKRISTLELTICHETKVIASRTYKKNIRTLEGI